MITIPTNNDTQFNIKIIESFVRTGNVSPDANILDLLHSISDDVIALQRDNIRLRDEIVALQSPIRDEIISNMRNRGVFA